MTDLEKAARMALEALERCVATCFDRYAHEQVMSRPEHFVNQAITALRQALEQSEQSPLDRMAENARTLGLDYEPVQKPVACAVCNEVHAILDADASRIIRNAADGYPEGRASRVLTLQERVAALCVYAADWRRWCLEKENAPPTSKPWVGLTPRERIMCRSYDPEETVAKTEAKLKEKNT